MAENEGNGAATITIAAAEDPPEPPSTGEKGAEGLPDSTVQPGQEPESSSAGRTVQTEPAGSGALLASVFPVEQSTMVGTEFTDLSTTTIIYVQPDGTLLEGGSGLTAEEQQAVLNQISKHQIMQVSDTEAAQLFQQTQLMETIPVQKTVLDSSQLQQVIDQVSKTQNPVQISQQGPQQNNNASQQLKTVAQHVALQYSPVQSEPVKIQIQVPPKQEGGVSPQPKSAAVIHPQVKLSPSGGLSNTQIFHLQPVVSQGQQILLQQNPEDPPIQLLLQSSTPVVGSLLPLVHKLTSPVTVAGVACSPAPKPAAPSIRAPTTSTVKTSVNKTPLTTSSRTISIPLISLPCNGTDSSSIKSLVKPVAAPAQPSTVSAASQSVKVTTLSVVRERGKEKEKGKGKKKEKKGVKVQTRSGRVSRPPKYKAKDYKFIKTEDLAESHQSDSDDYSDMSEEEEQGENARKDDSSGVSSLVYSHKSRCHQCQTCDKSYIGPGGLNRHYKLNPTHGEPDLSISTPTPLRDEDRLEETEAAREQDEKDTLPVAATNTAEIVSTAASGLGGLRHRGPGRPRGRGRRRGGGRGQFLGPAAGGFGSRPVHRGRYPRTGVVPLTADQQLKRRRDRLQELVEQCEVEELTDVVLPRLTKVLSLWELLLAKVDCKSPTCASFPDIYREFESLQAQVRQAAQEYITSPQSGDKPVEVRNIEVARSLGILDEVNRMKVVPGASPASSLTNKNVRYMGNSKMLPPSKRFKMENSITDDQRGSPSPQTGGGVAVTSVPPAVSPLKPCSVTVSPLVISHDYKLKTTSADSTSSSFEADSAQTTSSTAPRPATPMEVQEEGSTNPDQDPCTTDAADETTELQNAPGASSENTTKTTASSSDQTTTPSQPQQDDTVQPESCEVKQLQEGQEIYIQTEQLTVQLAEPGSDGIVIVNGPDGTTMHIQTPEGVPLEAVQALLGIEAADGDKVSQ
ncbi:uncharacterized protein znf839 [Nematolebias whitei]|uniref:uncharacterized protein znf839 n=1 Tax=Nematolebias whitei TaxID=451745 RepID=UPI00189B816A|nr:uncharacterized protein znf839 [Nematolebias whitei]